MLGNREMAVQLYRWNSELSAAYWEAIAYVEVALRNLIDEKMTLRQHSLGRGTHWIFDDFFELARATDEDLETWIVEGSRVDELIKSIPTITEV